MIWRLVPMAVGIAVVAMGLSTQPPTQPSAAIVLFGLVALGASTLADFIVKIGGLGFHIEMRNPTERAPRSIESRSEAIWNSRCHDLGLQTLDGLLAGLPGPLDGCQAQVFLHDEVAGRLAQVHPRDEVPDGAQTWEVVQAVAAVAFARAEYVSSSGDDLLHPRWGLDTAQQRRFAGPTAVAAALLRDGRGRMIGVLTLASSSPTTELMSEAGRGEHRDLARPIAVCVAELLVDR